MKKTLMMRLASGALFAIASVASAIVCTIDQRPAATLLVPYFQAAFNADGTVTQGPASLDTLVTIANASSAPMIAHVSIYNERSTLVLDFNIALTGFDVQALSMAAVLSGQLPNTPNDKSHVLLAEPCQRNPLACSGPLCYLRIRPATADTANPLDNTLATTQYGATSWQLTDQFAANVLESLSDYGKSLGCPVTPTLPVVVAGPVRGYILIDHANYCNLSDPTAAGYFPQDAAGNENNLIGEIIFVSGGTPTFGVAPVSIESSRVFSTQAAWGVGIGGGGFATQTDTSRERTFYARYWTPSGITRPNNNTALFLGTVPPNPWNQGFGDEREPTGLKFATRYFDSLDPIGNPLASGVHSFFRVWRASAGTLTSLTGSSCTIQEPSVNLAFYDEDENTFTPQGQPPCPSPCTAPPPSVFNFPKETQRTSSISLRNAMPTAFQNILVGWLSTSFVNLAATSSNYGGLLDQAWMDYEFIGAAAFYNASIPGTQLDPTTCHPLLIPLVNNNTTSCAGGGCAIFVPDALTDPVTPGGQTGQGTNPTIGTGP